MSERTVADETLTPGASTTCWEPTGWAVPMYSVTTAFRIADLRESRPASVDGGSSALRSSTVGMGLTTERWCMGPGAPPGTRSDLALHSSEC